MKKLGLSTKEAFILLVILTLVTVLADRLFIHVVFQEKRTSAATEMMGQIQEIGHAYRAYVKQTGYHPATMAHFKPSLLASGLIERFPSPPAEWRSPSAEVTPYSPGGDPGWFSRDDGNYAGTPHNDYVVGLHNVREGVCAEFNEKFSVIGARIPFGDELDWTRAGMSICIKLRTSGENMIFALMDVY